ncbi:MAG: hypothetical protein CSA29_03765 [Desulfobacterales bacterium]|nr:MAG: hypothetical protein CSA29_03765 [Desulfobacterales bacterium]
MREHGEIPAWFTLVWICLFPILALISIQVPGCTFEPVETVILLPVDFSNVPDDMVLTQSHTETIELKIKGTPDRINMLNIKRMRYPADLYTDLEFDPAGDSDSIEAGRYLLPIDPSRIPLDPGITILEILPSFLSVQLDRKITKTFRVTVPYFGKTAKGYMALAPCVNPPTVDLTGAQTMIENIEILRLKPVDLGNASESFKKEVPLDLDNPLLFPAARPMFIVTVPIKPRIGVKALENLAIELKHAPIGVSIEPSRIDIEIKGPENILANNTILDQIVVFMDLKGLKPGVYARHAYIHLPVELVLTKAVPQVFTVTIPIDRGKAAEH